MACTSWKYPGASCSRGNSPQEKPMIQPSKNGATACAIALALFATFACSRRAEPVHSSGDASRLRPAAGPLAPVSRNCMRSFRTFDSNGNGRVSKEEFFAFPNDQENAPEIFASRDSSRDGVLTANEFCARWRTGATGPSHAPGTGPLTGPAVRAGASCSDHYAAYDTNSDGSVTIEEFSAWPHIQGDSRLIFAARDRNNNGVISRAEFCSAWSAP
jgi:Ca2+-binding EF-hand superfamily protein